MNPVQKKQKQKPVRKTQQKTPEIAPNGTAIYLWAFVCSAAAFMLYFNTIGHDYVLDDYFAITSNKLVQEGVHGIPSLLLTDFWNSAGKELGYYRPLSLITFALEYQFFGLSPHISHLINVILYAFLVFMLFLLVKRLFPATHNFIAFLTVLLFTAHPLHTEVVANIKGRDELFSFLSVTGMLYFAIAYRERKKRYLLIIAMIIFYLGLISKESALTGIVLLPLALYYKQENSLRKLIWSCSPFILVILIFFCQKAILFGLSGQELPDDILFYPYRATEVKVPSAFMMFLFYFRMMIYPHPLRYDYAYNQIPAITWSSPIALVGVIGFLGLVWFTIFQLRKRKLEGFALAFLLLSIFPAVGFLVLRGGIFAERLLFAPTFGYCLFVVLLFYKLIRKKPEEAIFKSSGSAIPGIVAVLAFLCFFTMFSIATVNRNEVW
ncbi:MAG: hypothetical protein ACOYM0_16195, partial [Bacteroidales bacterium]